MVLILCNLRGSIAEYRQEEDTSADPLHYSVHDIVSLCIDDIATLSIPLLERPDNRNHHNRSHIGHRLF